MGNCIIVYVCFGICSKSLVSVRAFCHVLIVVVDIDVNAVVVVDVAIIVIITAVVVVGCRC